MARPLPRLPAPLQIFPVCLGLLAGIFAFAPPASAISYRKIPLADGFDFPVGKPNGAGYYIRRGFIANDHMGEDWNGLGGSNTDLGDPVHSIAHGIVVYSLDYRSNWGNVIIVRHAFRESGRIYYVDSLYGHLDKRHAETGDLVRRGEKIGTIGTNHGMYTAHLHFEIRKNINISTVHRRYAMDLSNYHSPKPFIRERRVFPKEFELYPAPVECFETGTQNVFLGTKIAAIPELPFGKPAPLPYLAPEVEEILKRHDLYPGSDEEVRPTPEEQTNKAERDKIRDFWLDYKAKILEKERVQDPVE